MKTRTEAKPMEPNTGKKLAKKRVSKKAQQKKAPVKKKKKTTGKIASEFMGDGNSAALESIQSLPSETWAISSITLDVANANTHNERSIEVIQASISRFGQVQDLVIRPDGRLVGGEGRVLAMKALGWKECTVKVFRGSDAEAMALAIALNRTAQVSDWDYDRLNEQVDFLSNETDIEIEDMGFNEKEMDELFADFESEPDAITDKSAEPKGQSSDAGSDSSAAASEIYEVVVSCSSEADQRTVFELMTERGYDCKVLTV